jgi:hypothetical protein
MADFGGEMRFSFAGNPITLRGKVTIEPSSVKVEPITNQDGSVSRTLTPKGFTAELAFEDTGPDAATELDWDGILRNGPYDMSLVEDHNGLLHTWSSARFVGDAKVDRMTGEVTGLQVHSQTYRKRTST